MVLGVSVWMAGKGIMTWYGSGIGWYGYGQDKDGRNSSILWCLRCTWCTRVLVFMRTGWEFLRDRSIIGGLAFVLYGK